MMMMKKKKIQEVEEEERNSEGGGSTSAPPPTDSPPRDRISELPVEILHHILGFLEMDECLIQTSLVSTKWRNLWKSVSNLNFPRCSCLYRDIGNNNVEKYQKFVDRVLRLRDSQASNIQVFKYNCDGSNSRRRRGGGGGGYDDYLKRIQSFIVGAQEIEIIMGIDAGPRGKNKIIHFNPSIFTSGKQLRKFTFTVSDFDYLIQFPRSMCCATQLTHLSLDGIRLPQGSDDDSNAKLHLVCPLLETLDMDCCYSKHLKVLDISAPKLKYLSICNTRMRNTYFDGLGECRIEIRTPNLTSLYYSGNVYVDCFTENLPLMTDAILDFSMETGLVEKTASFAAKLLKGLTSAKSLTLSGLEVFPDESVIKELFEPFTCLTSMHLRTSSKISSIHGMVHILNNCNSLQLLLWCFVGNCTVEGDDEHLMLPHCRLSHLECVHILRLNGCKNQIEFVKFLMKSSVVLQSMVINTTGDSPKTSIEENLKQFIEEEPSVRSSIKLEIL